MPRLKIETSVPESHLAQVLDALHTAGAGRTGPYERCASTWPITGRWLPTADARPYDGTVGQVQQAREYRIDSFCDQDQAPAVLKAVREAHPYEEVVINFLPLYDPTTDPVTD
ncbi:hypothetical protein [Streptomyces sp. NRRL WC-3742]|uniref:hypothetical protein n=1 Tax=Streptomyces sp. NRRL WC-3742 TaxID=1463934 RepID=UPI0004C79041|nr:hypothetical protein [Streptomyces sp. NRRL WC-3742]